MNKRVGSVGRYLVNLLYQNVTVAIKAQDAPPAVGDSYGPYKVAKVFIKAENTSRGGSEFDVLLERRKSQWC